MEKTSDPKDEQLHKVRHSLAHLMAAAVMKKFPGTELGIGPTIEDGFYYDFKLPSPISPDDLKGLEADMRKLIAQKLPFTSFTKTAAEAKKLLKGQPFKLELVEELEKEGKQISFYMTGEIFTDLCAGPHVENTSEIDPDGFTLSHIAGAYWRGSEKNPQLTRIYGVAFATKAELDTHLAMLEEAKKRDHRKLGAALKLFTFSDYVGPGLPLWLPNGTIIIEELERLAKDTERAAGYKQVRTPHIAKELMYKTSGHLPYYAETMFPPMHLKEENGETMTYYLKAMNCPHHHQIYAAEPRSYRDLPLRLAEYGTVYRYEKSGELFGLMRVRMLSMNDAHIYCTAEQFESEFRAVNDLYLNYFKLFGLTKYVMRFSTHAASGLGKKYVNDPELWKKTEDMVRGVLDKSGINYVEVADEAAFYGPKIDVQVWSSIGREFTIATNQVDFAVPGRFGLTYTDTEGKPQTPLVIHRAPLGTHERFIGFLIEHYAGNFPLWLSPVQARVIAVSDKFQEYGKEVRDALAVAGIRVELVDCTERLGKRIREAEVEHIPYILVIGGKEVEARTVSVRHAVKGDQGAMPLSELAMKLKAEIQTRA